MHGGCQALGTADGTFPTLELAGNGISIVLLIFTILEFCIAVATANCWCRATRLSPNEVAGEQEAEHGVLIPLAGDKHGMLFFPFRPC